MLRAACRWSLVAVTLLAVGTVAIADGILVPPLRPDVPYFTIKYHHVKVEIDEQVSTTHVDQVFLNETDREQEATYIFPLPPGAVVREFVLVADGERMEGEILPRDQAVAIYEEIVRKRRDPALLEYMGRDTFRARIYPIPARGERRIEITYTEVLPYDNGLVAYNYPMSTEKFSKEPITETVFEARIKSTARIGAIYSPTHDVDVAGRTHEATVSYEEKDSKPDRDLMLYYSLAQEDVGISVLPFKQEGEDGFFLLLAAPPHEQAADTKAPPKTVIFVLDRSGSMAGEKIEQARNALRFCVESLNPEDEFEIVTFASSITSFADGLAPAGRDEIARARRFIGDIRASGGTDIHGALLKALETRKAGTPNYIAFLTDGLPTVGEIRDPDEILKVAEARMGESKEIATRVFSFGVGYDVDTRFLDGLSDDNGGVSTYVRPTEDIEVKVSNWYGKIARPVLTGLALDFGTVKAYDMHPQALPDLFHGSQLTILGRYRADSAGKTDLTLSGEGADGRRSFTTAVELPALREGTDYVATLWAARRIGYLLDQVRLHGKEKEIVDEIVALSTRYGILTEYTAFLADEDRTVPRRVAVDRAAAGMVGAFGPAGPRGERGPAGPAGAMGVSRAQSAQQMRDSLTMSAQNQYLDAEGRQVRIANVQNRGGRGFVLREGQWQDLEYDPTARPVDLQVQAFSEAYFQLSRAFPTANQLLAVSDNMILVLNDRVVQIGPEGKTELTEEELRELGAPAAG